ncbi:4'-phosphopantetheinyl transferase superfamily protein [Streptomyces katrae]|uniref:4'-phosphopantetheinyl transferase superfamily protein n=1 Tax=Streptomyces katrae TaxID=68223 RepID=A0ABT7GVU5_9ACTN|nr:4'-phosphopantetheinyl transferase superfamily protein [Streptomyces katrae]MDK9497416.1 4'-phosphopantetheinyl transferase superfamily protein [Streptomyces katrae]
MKTRVRHHKGEIPRPVIGDGTREGTLIGSLLPPAVATSEAFTDPVLPTPLFASEEELIAGASPGRRREFSTSRACAREAMADLGVAPVPVLRDAHGAPLWPAGVVGSMAHSKGYRCAAVARSTDVAGIGIDVEPNEPLRHSMVRERVTIPEERGQLARLSTCPSGIHWDRLLFAAKESVYKAWYPLTGVILDFDEAAVAVNPWSGTFKARVLGRGPVVDGVRLSVFHGRWLVEDGLVITAVALPAPDRGAGAPNT